MLLIPTELRHSPIHGIGVFATAPVPANTEIWQFDPGIDQRHPVGWLAQQAPHVRAYVQIYGVLSLDKSHYYLSGDGTKHLNHSSKPNVVPHAQLRRNGEEVFVAARAIAPGEELTVNYGDIDGADRDKIARGEKLF